MPKVLSRCRVMQRVPIAPRVAAEYKSMRLQHGTVVLVLYLRYIIHINSTITGFATLSFTNVIRKKGPRLASFYFFGSLPSFLS